MSTRDPNKQAKHSHYVSNANGGIYPAQTGLVGIEDDNPIDWRPATYDEIEAFKAGKTSVQPQVRGQVDLGAAVSASPKTLTLAEDDAPVPAAPVPPAVQPPGPPVVVQAPVAQPPVVAAETALDPPPAPPSFTPPPAFPAAPK